MTRPRGYFGVPRDRIVARRHEPAGGHPAAASPACRRRGCKLRRRRAARPIVGEFNDERIVGRTWPAADNHVVLLELHLLTARR